MKESNNSDMFHYIPRVSVNMGPQPENPPAQKLLSRRENLPTPTLREERVGLMSTIRLLNLTLM